ncbi:Rid family detoxifying hydrolase [Liquorilactobacillus mali]|uniref:Rid family detoxifying hydrolase n=1 Tax=Liquorilactobacillus mali TaxID=1618 RepID=UPI002655E076|nr:Rid family detoxifying hydrolase [Liquorilactobacillus mali]MDN7144816.1 Rid family detoxifying hydrolase [Liquorilactobacillus mali]
MINKIQTSMAPDALGAYSQAIRIGNSLYCSGQIGIDPATKKLKNSDVSVQAEQALKNLRAVINVAGFDIQNIVKSTIFMININDFSKINEVYNNFFKDSNYYPARSAVSIIALPGGAKVEIEVICQK